MFIQNSPKSAIEKTRKPGLDALIETTEELHCCNLLVSTYSQAEKIEYKNFKIKIASIFNSCN